jgi:sugar/nucleoside kinase (ribokinase family)
MADILDIHALAASRPVGLLAVGDPNLDIVSRVDRIPGWGEKVVGKPVGQFAGGTAANVACAASLLGVAAAAFGRVGSDAQGRFLLAEYRRFGVRVDHVYVAADTPSATATIMIGPDGEKALVYLPMPAQSAVPASLAEAIRDSAIVYAMPYDLDELRTISKLARAVNTQVAIDIESAVAPDRARLDALLQLADIAFFNEGGFVSATGKLPGINAMRALISEGPHTIVVTRGAAGAIAVNRNSAVQCPAFPATVADTSGAGDCFNAAFMAGLITGRPLAEAVRFSAAAASFAVASIGAREGFPSRADVDALMQATEPRIANVAPFDGVH